MNIKSLIGTALDTIVKVVVLAFAVMLIFKGITKAYDFGYRVFADEPMSANNGRTITVGIAEDASVKDIATMLEDKGLIADSKLFVVQELLSAYHDRIQPGMYDLSTDMKAAEMLQIMSTPAENDTSDTVSSVSNTEEESIEEAPLNPENEITGEFEGEELPADTEE